MSVYGYRLLKAIYVTRLTRENEHCLDMNAGKMLLEGRYIDERAWSLQLITLYRETSEEITEQNFLAGEILCTRKKYLSGIHARPMGEIGCCRLSFWVP